MGWVRVRARDGSVRSGRAGKGAAGVAGRQIGVGGGQEDPYSFVHTSGLYLYDDFKETGAQNAVAGDWTENESVATDLRLFAAGGLDKADQDNVTDSIERVMTELGGAAGDVIIGAHLQVRATTDDSIPSLLAFFDSGSSDWYDLQLRDSTDALHLRIVEAAGLTDERVTGAVVSQSNVYQARMVIERSGANTLLRSYMVGASTTPTAVSGTDITNGDFSAYGAVLTHVGGKLAVNVARIELHDKSGLYQYYACGRNIAVTGIPTGFKVQIDSRTAVAETAGAVTLDADKFEFPWNVLKLLDADDVEVGSVTPTVTSGRAAGGSVLAGGGWGGDTVVISEN